MIKKFLHLYSENRKSNEVIRTKSEVFKRYREIFAFNDSDFVVSEPKDKLKILELVNLELFNMLAIRVEPPIPEIQYVPIDQMYVLKRVFGKKYKLLQGNDFDNNVLLFNSLKLLLEGSIIENKNIFGQFVNTIKECELPR